MYRMQLDNVVLNVLRLLNSSQTFDTVFGSVQKQLQTALRCDYVVFTLYEPGIDAAQVYLPDPFSAELRKVAEIKYENTDLYLQIKRGEPLLLSTLEQDPSLAWFHLSGVKTLAVLPLTAHGQVIGTFSITWTHHVSESDELMQTFRELAGIVGLAVERSRAHRQLDESLRRTQALHTASSVLIAPQSLSRLLDTVVTASCQAVGADVCGLLHFDIERQKILHITQTGSWPLHYFNNLTYEDLSYSLSGWVTRHRQAVLSPKDKPDMRESSAVRKVRRRLNVGSIIVAPVQYGDQILGTLTAINRMDRPDFTQGDLELINALANQSAIAIEKARLIEVTKERSRSLEATCRVNSVNQNCRLGSRNTRSRARHDDNIVPTGCRFAVYVRS